MSQGKGILLSLVRGSNSTLTIQSDVDIGGIAFPKVTFPKSAWLGLPAWMQEIPLASLGNPQILHFNIGLIMRNRSKAWLYTRNIIPSERYTDDNSSCQYTVWLCGIDEEGSCQIREDESGSSVEFYALDDGTRIRLDALAVAGDTPSAIIKQLDKTTRPKVIFSTDDLKLPSGLDSFTSWSQHLLNPIPGLVGEARNRNRTV